MSAPREEILANFQGCTGIENVEEAIMWLDNAEWDLLNAIKAAIPQESQDQSNLYTYRGRDKNTSQKPNGVPVTLSSDFAQLPSTSESEHILEIVVHYSNHTFKIHIPDNMTVGCVKTIIYSDSGVSPCQQIITGWPAKPSSDSMQLKKLKMPGVSHLYLSVPHMSPDKNRVTEMDVSEEPPAEDWSNRPGTVRDSEEGKKKSKEPTGVKSPELTETFYHGRRTRSGRRAKRLKSDGVVAQEEDHSPAPEPSSSSYVPSPVNSCRFREEMAEMDGYLGELYLDLATETDSSPEDFEDASETFPVEEDLFTEEASPATRIAPLIPDNVDDETAGSVHFIDSFTLRYGNNAPSFLPGSLEDAIKEACYRSAREKRLLAIYLHHDGSVLSNVFCTELLGFETVLQTFASYFVVWGWDITNPGNRDMFLKSVTRLLGPPVTETIQSISTDSMPALLILSRTRSNIELLNVIYGNIGINELLSMLIHAVDVFTDMQETEVREETERAARERIKMEQDKAYQQSLQIDRAKEEAKKQQMMLQTQEEERVKKEQQIEEEKRQAERLAVQSLLPDEPTDDSPDSPVITFRFRPPTGECFERKFLLKNELKIVFNYLLVKGYRIDEFKVISPWPRRDLSALDGKSLLCDINLCPQESIILEER